MEIVLTLNLWAVETPTNFQRGDVIPYIAEGNNRNLKSAICKNYESVSALPQPP